MLVKIGMRRGFLILMPNGSLLLRVSYERLRSPFPGIVKFSLLSYGVPVSFLCKQDLSELMLRWALRVLALPFECIKCQLLLWPLLDIAFWSSLHYRGIIFADVFDLIWAVKLGRWVLKPGRAGILSFYRGSSTLVLVYSCWFLFSLELASTIGCMLASRWAIPPRELRTTSTHHGSLLLFRNPSNIDDNTGCMLVHIDASCCPR